MRLLLTLLADGLKCLSAGGEGEGEGASEKRRVWQSSEIVVRALMAAVTAVGAVAECHRLASLMLRRSAAVPLGAGDGGVMASDQEENGAGFAMVLQEALSSIAVAVCRNLVPLAKEGSADAEVRGNLTINGGMCGIFTLGIRGENSPPISLNETQRSVGLGVSLVKCGSIESEQRKEPLACFAL